MSDQITQAKPGPLPVVVSVQMLTALELLLARYVDLVNSGDCGHWDPESDGEVQLARAAIAAAKGAGHE